MATTFVPSITTTFKSSFVSLKKSTCKRQSSFSCFPSKTPLCSQKTAGLDEKVAPSKKGLSTSAFGRGTQFPRRMVGLYELERQGIDLKTFISKDTRDDAAFAAVIGFFVLSIVVFPLITPGPSLEGPLSAIAGVLLTIWAVDSLSLGGMLGRAMSLAVQNRKRVACHEAGHFLVGFLLGFDIEGYSLPSPRAVLQEKNEAPGVRFGECRASGDAHRVSAVGMAGIAGEVLKYGTSEGGAEDMADVSRGIKRCYGGTKVREATMKGIVRWGLIESVQLLREHAEAHDKLCEAMLVGSTTEECLSLVERYVNQGKLLEATAA